MALKAAFGGGGGTLGVDFGMSKSAAAWLGSMARKDHAEIYGAEVAMAALVQCLKAHAFAVAQPGCARLAVGDGFKRPNLGQAG